MYKFETNKRRINWLYKSYCNTEDYSTEEFIRLINEYYYKHSAGLYKSRYIRDIEDQYVKMFKKLGLHERKVELNIVNIGAGQGFEYHQFQKNNVYFNRYYFVEPDSSMIDIFKTRIADNRLELINKLFTRTLADDFQSLENKVIVMNSCLHHFIRIDDFLNLIKSTMSEGDTFVLSHEPNNSYSESLLRYPVYFIKLFFSLSVFYKIGLLKNNETILSTERWKKINADLVKIGILKRDVRPLVIRRIIDYGVNTKNDWKLLNIPASHNEGHWTPKTIIDFFGEQFTVKHFSTYRHFGDSNGNPVLAFLNYVSSNVFHRSKKGSVFNIVLEKRSSN